jgi:hypothetical protein
MLRKRFCSVCIPVASLGPRYQDNGGFATGLHLITLSSSSRPVPSYPSPLTSLFFGTKLTPKAPFLARFALRQVHRQKDPVFVALLARVREGTHTPADIAAVTTPSCAI